MALNASNSNNLEQLALKGLRQYLTQDTCFKHISHISTERQVHRCSYLLHANMIGN